MNRTLSAHSTPRQTLFVISRADPLGPFGSWAVVQAYWVRLCRHFRNDIVTCRVQVEAHLFFPSTAAIHLSPI